MLAKKEKRTTLYFVALSEIIFFYYAPLPSTCLTQGYIYLPPKYYHLRTKLAFLYIIFAMTDLYCAN
jgi:hypothetical protein